ncbi:hypothetical protein J2T56_001420 [Natronobacillus azotifigens]|uniref:DUF4352 domain-containing protein n=1 Tax=Natronobacillus azotifigens TaxID=472978 RepID=A0A9J6RCR1_9BACI|nr:hypothetical protein [Natronobacillus azotifigens]MCZ0703142.1 hypothetical protein [Natronobacillus azotifigens]
MNPQDDNRLYRIAAMIDYKEQNLNLVDQMTYIDAEVKASEALIFIPNIADMFDQNINNKRYQFSKKGYTILLKKKRKIKMKKFLLSLILIFALIGCNDDDGASPTEDNGSTETNETTENEENGESTNDSELEPGHESYLQFGEKGTIIDNGVGAHFTIQHHGCEFVNKEGEPVAEGEEPSYILIEVALENLSEKEWDVQAMLRSTLYYNNGMSSREGNYTGGSEDLDTIIESGDSIRTTVEYRYHENGEGMQYISKNEEFKSNSNVVYWEIDFDYE